MEEKSIKINNLEVSCTALIEFSSLANVLLELAKKQKEMEKKLNDQDIKINNIKQIISHGGGGGSTNWQEKENEISNILDDQYNLNMNSNLYNNSNLSNDLNNDNNNLEDINNMEDINNNMEDGKNLEDENNNEEDKNKYDDNKNELTDKNNKEDRQNKDGKEIQSNIQTNQKNKAEIQSLKQPKENETGSDNISSLIKKEMESIKNAEGDSKKTADLVSKILKRVIILEKKVGDLTTKSGEHTILIKNIQNNRISINENSKKIKNLNELIKKLKEEIENLKTNFKDFNVFEMFKDSGDGNIDAAKGMVLALESKLKKRMDLIDDKCKLLSTENFKNKGDIQNINAVLDNANMLINKNRQNIEEILKNKGNENEPKNPEENNKDINDLNQKIEEIKSNIENYEKITDNKLKILEEKLKDEFKNVNNEITKSDKRKIDPDLSHNIKEMNEKLVEVEKKLKYVLKKFNVDEVNSNLAVLQKEILKKGNQTAIDELNDRIYVLDELLKEVNSKCDSFTAQEIKYREDNSIITKKIESLASQIHRLSLNDNKSQKEEKSIIDFTKFIDLNTFDDNKKDINRRFDKIRISFEDILRHIEEILEKLSHTPTDKDFSQFQGIVKSMIDELKINCNKKYADKCETTKNVKYLETQIKSINDQYIKKAEGQDNWLLAKKPMSNFLCASCESVIRGELDKRSEYIPWNKYPMREDRYTRMGHGFSHMLQLVNDDIRKNVEHKEKTKERSKSNEKGYNSDEDKKKNASDKSSLINTSINVKLPKVRQRTKNFNLNILDEALPDKVGGSPYENKEKNQSILDSNNNGPYIVKISKLKKVVSNKRSFNETTINEENSNRGKSLNVKTFPSELDSFEKKPDSE